MKNIAKKIILLIGVSVLGACAEQKEETKKSYSPPAPVVIKDVTSITSTFVLHAIEDSIIGPNGKNYQLVYDYPNRYLDINNDDSTRNAIRDSLPEYITVKSLRYGIVTDATIISPLSNFTDSVLKKIAHDQGIKFEDINRYQLGNMHDVVIINASKNLLDILQNKNVSLAPTAPANGKSLVNGIQGVLTKHPIKHSMKGNDTETYYYFLDPTNHCLFFTDKLELYTKFSKALPILQSDNRVIIQAITIDPYVVFDSESLKEMTRDQGLQISGDKNGTDDINAYKVAKIANYGIVLEYTKVIEALQKKVSGNSNSSSKQTPPSDTKTSSSAKRDSVTIKSNGRKSFKPRTNN